MAGRLDLVLERTTEGYQGQRVPYIIPTTVYPTQTGTVIINAPGAGESKEGRGGRYTRIAQALQESGVGSVVLYSPPRPDGYSGVQWDPYTYRGASWNRIAVESMRHVVGYALEHAEELCGAKEPVLYLAGFSAGGSVCGAVAADYGAVQKLLLVSAYDSVGESFYAGIRAFEGEVYMVYGDRDPLAGFLAYVMPSIAPAVRAVHVRQVADCDHGFSGERNERELRQAYLWAFGEGSPPGPSARS
jgi:hypothetical protein